MNVGIIWGELDEMDRTLLDMVLFVDGNPDLGDYKRTKRYNKIIFIDMKDALSELKMNIVYCDGDSFYKNIDNEVKRTKRIIRLIEDIL